MSNEMTTVEVGGKMIELSEQGRQFVALTSSGELAEAQAMNGEGVTLSSLVRVKTPSGGSTVWQIDDGFGNLENAERIRGALVVYQKQATLWPTVGEAVEGQRPVLVSHDMRVGIKRGDDLGDIDPDILDAARIENTNPPQYYVDEERFYYARWDSGRNGGKWMKEQRVLGILRPGDMFPLLVTIQPSSLVNITKVVSRFTLPHFRYIVELSLVAAKNSQGQKYSQVVMRVEKETLPSEEGELLRKLYRDPLTRAIVGGEVEAFE